MKKSLFILGGALLFLTACNDGTVDGGSTAGVDTTAMKQEQKEERNKQTAMACMEGIQKRDAEQVFSHAAADFTEYYDGSMPPTKGGDSAKASLKAWLDAMESIKGSNLVYTADGDYVMVYGDWEGKYKSDFMGMKTAGKSYKLKDVDILKFNDEGKIVEHRAVQNSATALMQMGIQPPKQ